MPAPPLQNFIDQVTIVKAAWLNPVDVIVTTIFEQVATKPLARSALVNDLTAVGHGFEIVNGGTGATDGLNLSFRGVDSGVVNAYVVTTTGLATPLLSLNTGTIIRVVVNAVNTGPATLTLNGFGPAAIVDFQGNALGGGELTGLQDLFWNGAAWQMRSGVITSLNKRTAAEIALAVVPSNYAYAPGHVLRYHTTGVLGVSAASDTAAVNSMFSVCIKSAAMGGTSSCVGVLIAGIYKINEGVLAYSTPFINAPFPIITTAAAFGTIFVGQNFADAPLLSFSNGVATSTAFQGWRNGYLGGIYFQTTRSSGSSSHGLQLTGVWGTTFGYMRGDNLWGDVLYLPNAKYSGTDPDPYNVALCHFQGIEANGCFHAVNNQNDIGFTCNIVDVVNFNACTQGGIFSGGDTVVWNCITGGNSLGWAYDEGQNGSGNGAARNVILGAEIDSCQNGIRVNKCFSESFTGIRFIHRYNNGLNTSNTYWPQTSIDIAGGTFPSIQDLLVRCMHRIEVGGTKGVLGTFVSFHSAAGATTSSVEIHQEYLDEGTGFTYFDTDFYSNVGTFPNILAAVFLSGRRIYDSRIASITLSCGSAATVIKNSGFNTAANIVQFPTAVSDRNGCFNTATGVWTAPYSGLARVTANVALTMAASNSTRMAVMELTSLGVYNTTLLYSEAWSVTANVQHYKLDGLIKVQQGFQYCLSMDQSTAGNLSPSLPSGAYVPDLYLHIEMLEAP